MIHSTHVVDNFVNRVMVKLGVSMTDQKTESNNQIKVGWSKNEESIW